MKCDTLFYFKYHCNYLCYTGTTSVMGYKLQLTSVVTNAFT